MYLRQPRNYARPVAIALGVTPGAVYQRASGLGLTRTVGRPRASQRWKEEEIEVVVISYDGTWDSVTQVAQKLGRPENGVQAMVQQLGLAKRKDRPRAWTTEEEERLEELFNAHPPLKVAYKLGRSVQGVEAKARRMGLRSRDRDGWYTAFDVGRILGTSACWVQRRIAAGMLKPTPQHGERPGKAGGKHWRISQRELKRVIRTYPEEICEGNIDVVEIVDVLAGVAPVYRRGLDREGGTTSVRSSPSPRIGSVPRGTLQNMTGR